MRVEKDESGKLNDMLDKHYNDDCCCDTLSDKIDVLIEKVNDLVDKTK